MAVVTPYGLECDYAGELGEKMKLKESKGANRVLRGGDWNSLASDLRAAYRSSGPPSYQYTYIGIGVRLVRRTKRREDG